MARRDLAASAGSPPDAGSDWCVSSQAAAYAAGTSRPTALTERHVTTVKRDPDKCQSDPGLLSSEMTTSFQFVGNGPMSRCVCS